MIFLLSRILLGIYFWNGYNLGQPKYDVEECKERDMTLPHLSE